jgi:hypothetical protein
MGDAPGPVSFLKHLNADGGLPYAPGMLSFSEPTLLMLLAFIASGKILQAQPLVDWALKSRNADGSIGMNREFPGEGLWNSPLLAIAMHHLKLSRERDAAIDFILKFRSISFNRSPENDVDTQLVGWPWVAQTFGWVEPTSWALLALALAGKADHPRAAEGRRLLVDRCLPEGGWNYGNKIVFEHVLMPFWDTTALALLALGDSNREVADRSLKRLEQSLPEMQSLLTNAWACICLARFGRRTAEIRNRVVELLGQTERENLNIAHSAIGLIAIAGKKVLTA